MSVEEHVIMKNSVNEDIFAGIELSILSPRMALSVREHYRMLAAKQLFDVGSTLMQKLKSTSWCLPRTYSSYIST
jgi:hypothetical protein